LLLLLAPALFAQEFSVRSIKAALEDELYPLAEQQIWNALSIQRTIEEKTDLTIMLVRSLIGQKHFEDAVILADESMHLLQPDAFTYWKARAFFEAKQIEQVFQTLEDISKNSSFYPAPAIELYASGMRRAEGKCTHWSDTDRVSSASRSRPTAGES